eukprot:8747850-Pyramimonas_sp.AAC.1
MDSEGGQMGVRWGSEGGQQGANDTHGRALRRIVRPSQTETSGSVCFLFSTLSKPAWRCTGVPAHLNSSKYVC